MIPLCESEGITILCCTSSTLLKSKHAKADSREECNTFPVLERKDKGRKLCLLSANSYGIRDGVKRNVFFLQRVSMRKLINESMQHVSLSGEMVESRILYVGMRESMLLYV